MYVVYAQEDKSKEQGLIVTGCGRTRLIKDATEDLKLLTALSESKTDKIPLASSLLRNFVNTTGCAVYDLWAHHRDAAGCAG